VLHHHFQKIDKHVHERSRIRIKDLFRLLEDDGLLVILAILSVLNIVLAPVPGNSIFLGLPMLICAGAYIFELDLANRNHRWMRRPLRTDRWRPYMPKSQGIFKKIDKFVKPRLRFFVQPKTRILAAISMFFMSFVIFLPIPFGNIPGSIGILLLCVGMLQKDGLLACIGYVIAVAHFLALAAFVVFVTV
jgi:hypothetical protein